jgi:hypothetical protein
MAYKVVAALRSSRTRGARSACSTERCVLPDGLDEEHLKHLLDLGSSRDESKSSKK